MISEQRENGPARISPEYKLRPPDKQDRHAKDC